MAKRICDKCGKEEGERGGSTCENGHFICNRCVVENILRDHIIFCTLCGTDLRIDSAQIRD